MQEFKVQRADEEEEQEQGLARGSGVGVRVEVELGQQSDHNKVKSCDPTDKSCPKAAETSKTSTWARRSISTTERYPALNIISRMLKGKI